MQEMISSMKKRIAASGILIGVVNVLLGSCGGILAVQSLKQNNVSQKKAHATSIAVILPLTVASAAIYLLNGRFKISESAIYIFPGIIGSVAGSLILPKINGNLLRKLFSCFIIYAGIRMLFK